MRRERRTGEQTHTTFPVNETLPIAVDRSRSGHTEQRRSTERQRATGTAMINGEQLIEQLLIAGERCTPSEDVEALRTYRSESTMRTRRRTRDDTSRIRRIGIENHSSFLAPIRSPAARTHHVSGETGRRGVPFRRRPSLAPRLRRSPDTHTTFPVKRLLRRGRERN